MAPNGCERVQADIESGPWPLGERQFDAVLVFNYLWRPLWPRILGALAPAGVLIMETFADGNQTVGRPARADFLLQPGELLQVCAGLRIVAFEDGYLDDPARFVQRVAAVRPGPESGQPPRHRLQAARG
jgi:SAM-dependent methyltransferase